MTVRQSIVFNGDLGSGKSTVSVEIAKRLGMRRVSVGDLYRQMAQERQMTALQLNLHAELDQAVDGYVDQLQRDIAASGERLVMDSRLAWHFFTDALKVHMITEPGEAARRVLARPPGRRRATPRWRRPRPSCTSAARASGAGSSCATAWTRPGCATTT